MLNDHHLLPEHAFQSLDVQGNCPKHHYTWSTTSGRGGIHVVLYAVTYAIICSVFRCYKKNSTRLNPFNELYL